MPPANLHYLEGPPHERVSLNEVVVDDEAVAQELVGEDCWRDEALDEANVFPNWVDFPTREQVDGAALIQHLGLASLDKFHDCKLFYCVVHFPFRSTLLLLIIFIVYWVVILSLSGCLIFIIFIILFGFIVIIVFVAYVNV